jgi:TPR repeat protein
MIKRTAGISLVLAAALLPTTVAFADVKAGVDAWARGDYPAAVRQWQAPAAKGDADAQFNLGQAYKLGRGVPADLRKAEVLFGLAAQKGHLQASDMYGLLLFQRGERAKALPYVRAAADRGEPRAQYLLGVAHFNGDNVQKDWVRAYALTSLAQQSGVDQAKAALAQMDRYIPLEQRQQAADLAPQLAI